MHRLALSLLSVLRGFGHCALLCAQLASPELLLSEGQLFAWQAAWAGEVSPDACSYTSRAASYNANCSRQRVLVLPSGKAQFTEEVLGSDPMWDKCVLEFFLFPGLPSAGVPVLLLTRSQTCTAAGWVTSMESLSYHFLCYLWKKTQNKTGLAIICKWLGNGWSTFSSCAQWSWRPVASVRVGRGFHF